MPEAEAPNTKNDTKKTEFNPRWKGYVLIGIMSLVNFASISSISRADRKLYWSSSMVFGLTTFSLVIIILAQDRSQRCTETFHFSNAKDGYVEGVTLLLCVVWWIVGVGYITRAAGIAYVANNIYFSAWFALFSCIYTLNEWSASKDILSIAELTGISTTLKSWWLLSLTSLVTFGTCIDLHARLVGDSSDDSEFGIGVSLVSFVVAFFWIVVHMDFIPRFEEGGWLELSSGFLSTVLWTIFLAIATRDQGIAATLTGNKCSRDSLSLRVENCTILLYERVGLDEEGNSIVEQQTLQCADLPRQVPGSNLYFASWICFFASLSITFRWKAQQALQFAQAQEEKQQEQLEGEGPTTENASIGDDDDDDDDEME